MKSLIIAHRGESYDAPENTLSSINLAWERGDEAVEIDVHLSADNQVVVIHDYSTRRTGGRNKKVKKQTVAELKQLDVGSWKNGKYKNETIPTLSEVLRTIPQGKSLIIEIKSDIGILPFLKHEIENFNIEVRQIVIISFSYSTVTIAKKLMPTYKVLYLADLDYTWYSKLISPSVEKLIAKVKKVNLDGLNVWAGKLLTKEFVQKIKSSGLLLYVWTVDDVSHAKKIIGWGIDGITTNRAQWLTKKLSTK
jgi:glycerophosphoryl diester phosphodiesterase